MGICNVCKKEIQYNKFKRYRGKILCPECYKTRLIRKKENKAQIEEAKLDAIEVGAKAAEFGFTPTDDIPEQLPPVEKEEEEGSKDD